MRGLGGCLVVLAMSHVAVAQQCGHWPGFDKITNLFTFGDSYSQTGFNISLMQPSPSNPMGNPPYPGWTSSNGPNWVGYLVNKYNVSVLLSYNIASGGATIDAKLAKPYSPSVHSLIDQVDKDFLPNYGNGRYRNKWNSKNTLFGIWMGVNDVLNTYGNADGPAVVNKMFDIYAELVEKMYKTGARNFVFLDAPALQFTPQQQKWESTLPALNTAVKTWATKLQSMADKLKAAHPDATTLVFSTNTVFANIFDKPSTYAPTARLKVLKPEYCEAYAGGGKDAKFKAPNCPAALNEYFWLNSLHPTFPVHEAVALELGKALESLKPGNLCSQR